MWDRLLRCGISVFYARELTSGSGQTATWLRVRATSALPPQSRHAPTRLARQFRAITGLMQCSKGLSLFDHLIGGGEQHGWDGDA